MAVGKHILRIFILSWVLQLTEIDGATVRVASFNVRNYLTMDRMVSGYWKKDYPKPSKEKRILRSIINQTNPDILALQEIGEPFYLNELWKDLNSTDGVRFSYSAWIPGLGEGEERHLALLSKFPFSLIEQEQDLSFKYFDGRKAPSRGLLEVEFETQGVKWSLFNVHLKSKWTERPDDPEASIRREREARVIRDYIRTKLPAYKDPNYLVVGDFNDHKNSAPLRRVLQVNNSSLTEMIPCEDSQGHFWTHYWDKQDSYSRFDYLLASPPMFKRVVSGSSRIGDFHLCLHASDHRIIFADLEF